MKSIEERNKLFYTEEGLNSLFHRMEVIVGLVNEGKIPFSGYLLGFGNSTIRNYGDALIRIQEISDIIGCAFSVKQIIEKDMSGKAITKYEVTI